MQLLLQVRVGRAALHDDRTDDGGGAPTSRASAFAAIGAASDTGLTVSLARGPQGIFLIGPDGHALYVQAKDQGTTSACTGRCATADTTPGEPAVRGRDAATTAGGRTRRSGWTA